jgi:hypothetical protein
MQLPWSSQTSPVVQLTRTFGILAARPLPPLRRSHWNQKTDQRKNENEEQWSGFYFHVHKLSFEL